MKKQQDELEDLEGELESMLPAQEASPKRPRRGWACKGRGCNELALGEEEMSGSAAAWVVLRGLKSLTTSFRSGSSCV